MVWKPGFSLVAVTGMLLGGCLDGGGSDAGFIPDPIIDKDCSHAESYPSLARGDLLVITSDRALNTVDQQTLEVTDLSFRDGCLRAPVWAWVDIEQGLVAQSYESRGDQGLFVTYRLPSTLPARHQQSRRPAADTRLLEFTGRPGEVVAAGEAPCGTAGTRPWVAVGILGANLTWWSPDWTGVPDCRESHRVDYLSILPDRHVVWLISSKDASGDFRTEAHGRRWGVSEDTELLNAFDPELVPRDMLRFTHDHEHFLVRMSRIETGAPPGPAITVPPFAGVFRVPLDAAAPTVKVNAEPADGFEIMPGSGPVGDGSGVAWYEGDWAVNVMMQPEGDVNTSPVWFASSTHPGERVQLSEDVDAFIHALVRDPASAQLAYAASGPDSESCRVVVADPAEPDDRRTIASDIDCPWWPSNHLEFIPEVDGGPAPAVIYHDGGERWIQPLAPEAQRFTAPASAHAFVFDGPGGWLYFRVMSTGFGRMHLASGEIESVDVGQAVQRYYIVR